MRRKLLLVNPVDLRRSGLTVNRSGRFAPLGLGIVAALTSGDWDIEILDENFERFRYTPADLVGISSFTAQINRAYEIAAIYREHGIPTVIGGVHASMVPDEALQYVDTVVIGEAESTWPKLLQDFQDGALERVYREDLSGGAKISGARHDLFHPDYVAGSIQTARGCPMDCDFCSVTTFNGGRYRQRETSDVLDELATIRQKFVYFVDDNLYGYGKAAARRAAALFDGIVERGIDKQWFSQASINFAESDAVLAKAAKAGCRMVFLGVEAETDQALEDAGKKLNRKRLDRYETVFKQINAHGIAVLGGFIYGMERDTPEDLRHRTRYVLENDIDAMQITLMTPLPGTRLFERLRDEGRLLYTNFPADWERYDMTEVVFEPRDMHPEQLFEELCNAGIQLYNHGTLWQKYHKTLRDTRSLEAASWAYSVNLNYQNAAWMLYVQRSLPQLWQLGTNLWSRIAR